MERRFRDCFVAALLAMTIFILFLTFPAFAAAQSHLSETEASSDSLAMIEERMKALSGSLAAMPEPPRLDQVIEIPTGYNPKETNE